MFRALSLFAACVMLTVGVHGQEKGSHEELAKTLWHDSQWAAAQEEFLRWRAEVGGDRLAAEQADHYIALCAARMEQYGAEDMLDAFAERYPNSIYAGRITFARGLLHYGAGEWEQAVAAFEAVDPATLGRAARDEYSFKAGVSHLFTGDYGRAASYMDTVSPAGPYGVHARYYKAYMSYMEGDYAVAGPVFRELAATEAYAELAPYYVFQIEYVAGNYDYVLEHGDALLAGSLSARRAEIARTMASACAAREDYRRALGYMEVYFACGGKADRDADYLTGYARYMLGDYAGATVDLVRVYGPQDDMSQNALYHLGDSYVRTGEQAKAMQAFALASAMEFDPDIRRESLFNYGQLLYESGGGTFGEAINILSRYVTQYPDSGRTPQAREYLAAAYYNSHNYAAAYLAIKQIGDPDNNMRAALQRISYFRALEYYAAGQDDQAMALLGESVATRANSKYTALGNFWRAEILYRHGDYSGAIPLYRDFMLLSPTTEPEHIMGNYNLAYCYFNTRQWAPAADYFDRFVKSYKKRDGYLADTYNRLGDIAFAERSYDLAAGNYDRAAAVGTDEKYYARYQRAIMSGLTGGNDRKIEALKAIVAAGEGGYVAAADYELGRTYIGMQRYADARQVLTGFIERWPDSPDYIRALSALGLVCQNLDDNAQAMRYYKMVVDKAPGSELAREAATGILATYMDGGNMDEYFAYARGAGIETDLGVVRRDSLSFVAAERQYVTAADKGRADGPMRNYIRDFPNGTYLPQAYYYVGESRLAAGDAAGAMDNYEQVASKPYNQFTIRALGKLGGLASQAGEHARAADAYRRLMEQAVDPATIEQAMTGYIGASVAAGDNAATVRAADAVLGRGGAPADAVRAATYAKAVATEAMGEADKARPLYTSLATETKTVEGAASTFKVVEELMRRGDLKAAQEMAIAMGKSNTPHTYWLGRTFVLLGDIYAQAGDAFQARATYQSIIDGYAPADDGVVEAARQRMDGLK